MKKLISLMLVLVLMLSCVSLVACGGGEEKEEAVPTPTPSPTPTPTPSPEPKGEPASGGFTWDDMPIYPGAERDKGAQAELAQDPGKMEWHCYKIGDSYGKVVGFYKSEMPKNGWQQVKWIERETTIAEWSMEQGRYMRNDWHDQASVKITDKGEGVVFITLQRVSD